MERISIIDELVSADDFNRLRELVGWETHPINDVDRGLQNTLFCVKAINQKNEIIGMARVIGDNGIIYYIQDVIVLPAYQEQGIGNRIMSRIMDYINKNGHSGMNVCLMAAKNKEGFYKRFGFIERPSEEYGPGMCLTL